MVEVKVIDVTPKRWGEELIASYLILGSKRTLLIETGPAGSYDQLKARLEEEGVRPDLVIVTHIHLDHAGAVGNLVRDYPNVKILVHPRGAKHLANPGKLWSAAKVVLGVVAQVYGEPLPVPESNLEPVEDGYVTDIGDGMVRIIHTPGHTPGSVSIMVDKKLFTGDTLFKLSIGRADLGGNLQELISSIHNKIFNLPTDTEIFPGHGEMTTINHEILYNPYVGINGIYSYRRIEK